ncbi:MAG: hypothetical protein SFX73_08490 [Kofleriaceae bacterium]|nr:hypothetical protein [Kofleriaceae bacterium]
MTTRDRIDRWLGELLATQSQSEGVMIVLVHAAVDQTQRTVKSWRLADTVENVEALITDVDEMAEQDAEGLGGRQRYVLRAQLKGRDVGSLTLRYEYRPDDGPAVDSEPATAAGTIAVLQRHAEGAMRMMVQSFSGVIESYKEQVNAQRTLIADFQRQAAENFRLQEELASRKLEQDLVLKERETHLQLTAAREAHEIEKSQLVWGEGIRKLMEWGPVILHYLTKGEAGRSPEDVMSEKRRQAEEQLFANATDAQIEEWRRALSPEQFAELMEGYRSYRARSAPQPRTGSGPSREDEVIARAGAALYGALGASLARLEPLAMCLVGREAYEALGADERALVDELAGETSSSGEIAGGALWSALLAADVSVLLPVVGRLREGTAWADLDRQAKLTVLGIAARAMRGAGRGEGAGG